MQKTTRKCFFECYCMCKNTCLKLKQQFPIGCAHTQGDCGKVLPLCQWLPIVDCLDVCVYCLPAFKYPGSAFFSIYSFVGQEFCSKTHNDFFDEAESWLKTPLFFTLLSSQQSHFLTSKTLLFQLFCVYGAQTEYPMLYRVSQ